MLTTAKRSICLTVGGLVAALSFAALGAKLDGDCLATGNSFFEKLSFRSGGKVRVTFMGMTKVGTY